MIPVKKLPIKIVPSSTRTLIRPFVPGSSSQVEHILFRVFSTPPEERQKVMRNIYERLELPDEDIRSIFLRHFENISSRIPSNIEITHEQKEFIGACFTQQYSLESTALFNPSIVPHPVQDKEGVTRFIISLRAIGEGHISSITFMEGEIDASFRITLQENSPVIYESQRKAHLYERDLFIRKSNELGILSDLNNSLLKRLPDHFTFDELERAINKIRNSNVLISNTELERGLNSVRMLALSNFTLNFSTDTISERAIYPASPSQSNGLEDARFVKFTEDDGSTIYYATFTAYDGKTVMPELLETYDFKEFKVSTLNGSAAKNKGMALFPRKVNGNYMMLGRQDNESLYIMSSDNPYFWHDYQPLVKPTFNWELIQIGNCGSPIEIDEGWLVITHGVGPVRTYSLGVILLDKDEPWRVIGRLKEPLLEPTKEERFGYVPNVLYTCGAMAIGRTLVLPYAIGDVVTTFTLVSIDELVRRMSE
ncbi:glycosidase [Leadbetterella sp. DM7]|uniref:glycoside hydrolase family 130 protein n=1 Tax=Leadbetterella sp. DM7 TaxID=3235085 RepID=UPI00349E91E5